MQRESSSWSFHCGFPTLKTLYHIKLKRWANLIDTFKRERELQQIKKMKTLQRSDSVKNLYWKKRERVKTPPESWRWCVILQYLFRNLKLMSDPLRIVKGDGVRWTGILLLHSVVSLKMQCQVFTSIFWGSWWTMGSSSGKIVFQLLKVI